MKKTNAFQTIFLTLCLLSAHQALAASPSPALPKKASAVDAKVTEVKQKIYSPSKQAQQNLAQEKDRFVKDAIKRQQDKTNKAICEKNCALGYDCVPHKNGFYACVPAPSGFLFPECETKSAPEGQNCIPSWSLKIQSPGKSVTSFNNYTHYAVQTCVKDADCGGWDRVCYKENICVDPNSNWLTTTAGKWDSAAAKPGTQQGALSADDVSDSLNEDCDLNAEPADQCESGETCYQRCEILEGYQGCRNDGNSIANCDAKFKKCNANLPGVCAKPCTNDAVCNDDDVCDLNRGHCVTAAQLPTQQEAEAILLETMATAKEKKLEYDTAVKGCSADDPISCLAYDYGDLEKTTIECPEGKIAVGVWGSNMTYEPIAPLTGLGLICADMKSKDEIKSSPKVLDLHQTDLVGPEPESEKWLGFPAGLTSFPQCPNDPAKGMGVLTGIRFRHWYNRVSTWQITCGYLDTQNYTVLSAENDQGHFGGMKPESYQCNAPYSAELEQGKQCTLTPDPKDLTSDPISFPSDINDDFWDAPHWFTDFTTIGVENDCNIFESAWDTLSGDDECIIKVLGPFGTVLDDNKKSYEALVPLEDDGQRLLTGIGVHYSKDAIIGLNLKYISIKDFL